MGATAAAPGDVDDSGVADRAALGDEDEPPPTSNGLVPLMAGGAGYVRDLRPGNGLEGALPRAPGIDSMG